MSVASFVACVRAGRVPTRSELLDAADALDAGCEVWCSCGDGIVANTGAMCGACIESRADAAEVWRDAFRALKDDVRRVLEADRGTTTKPLAAQFSPDRLPPETGFVHPVGKR